MSEFDEKVITGHSNTDELLRYLYEVKKVSDTKWNSWDIDRAESVGADMLAYKFSVPFPGEIAVSEYGELLLAQAAVVEAKFPFEVFYRLAGPFFVFVVTKIENKEAWKSLTLV